MHKIIKKLAPTTSGGIYSPVAPEVGFVNFGKIERLVHKKMLGMLFEVMIDQISRDEYSSTDRLSDGYVLIYGLAPRLMN